MSAFRNTPFQRIGAQLTLSEVYDLAKEALRTGRGALVVAIIALLLGLSGLIVGLVLGLGSKSQINYQPQIDNLQMQITNNQNAVYQALMNITSYNSTLVQSGTFNWTPGPLAATYTIHRIMIGPLNFDVLTLPPPTTPLAITGLSPFFFTMQDFQPHVSQLIFHPQGDLTPSGSGPIVIPLTSNNLNKIALPCLSNFTGFPISPSVDTCYETATASDYIAATGRNAIRILYGNPPVPSSYYLGGYVYYNPNTLLTGKTFTLNEPWQFVLPAL